MNEAERRILADSLRGLSGELAAAAGSLRRAAEGLAMAAEVIHRGEPAVYAVQSADRRRIDRAPGYRGLRAIARTYAARGILGAHPIFHRARRWGVLSVEAPGVWRIDGPGGYRDAPGAEAMREPGEPGGEVPG